MSDLNAVIVRLAVERDAALEAFAAENAAHIQTVQILADVLSGKLASDRVSVSGNRWEVRAEKPAPLAAVKEQSE